MRFAGTAYKATAVVRTNDLRLFCAVDALVRTGSGLAAAGYVHRWFPIVFRHPNRPERGLSECGRDWAEQESAGAHIRIIIGRILRKYGYPPDKQEKATQTVLEQAEVLCKDWTGIAA